MPIIDKSKYEIGWPWTSGHLQSLYPTLFRKVEKPQYSRQRIITPDADFLDIDWVRGGNRRVAVVLHGLEGSSYAVYVRGMARHLFRNGWDIAAMNFRSCSGESNQTLGFYHSGKTEDLEQVLRHIVIHEIVSAGSYDEISLIGFSIGGNIVLKYLGEQGLRVSPLIKSAVAISVPCDLRGSAEALSLPKNRIYMNRFLRLLRHKIRSKMTLFPNAISDSGFESIRNFKDFDDRYTAPLSGFEDAYDYWDKCSSKKFLGAIRVNTLIINALNDPFLSSTCFPVREAKQSKFVFLETPNYGGHVGFVSWNRDKNSFAEMRALEFLDSQSASDTETELSYSMIVNDK
ncbi:MAG: alpha/beta fold hydrolase [Bdellovibrionales bacterium]|nr:alpha/beta fold hydrolase [Bdellovibrionales bacterium]